MAPTSKAWVLEQLQQAAAEISGRRVATVYLDRAAKQIAETYRAKLVGGDEAFDGLIEDFEANFRKTGKGLLGIGNFNTAEGRDLMKRRAENYGQGLRQKLALKYGDEAVRALAAHPVFKQVLAEELTRANRSDWYDGMVVPANIEAAALAIAAELAR